MCDHILSLTHTSRSYSQGEHLKLVPLSATASPNISSDEHNLSDTEVSEHLYSLGRFVPSNKQGSTSSINSGSLSLPPTNSPPQKNRRKVGVTPPKRRVTHSAATSNLLADVTDHGSFASAEDTPPPSGHSSPMPMAQPLFGSAALGRHGAPSPQRSNTFSALNKHRPSLKMVSCCQICAVIFVCGSN